MVTCNFSKNSVEKKDNITIQDSTRGKTIESIDTLVGKFRVAYTINESLTDNIIKTNILSTGDTIQYKYGNRMIDLCIDYNKVTIFNGTISKSDFMTIIPKNKINELQIWKFQIENISDTLVTFTSSVCVPDTDDCYFVILSISNTGNKQIIEEEVEWED